MRKRIKNELLSFARCASSLFLLACLGSCTHNPPKHELCILGTTDAVCDDPRESPSEYKRNLSEMENYVCTNADDYFNVKSWVERKFDDCDK